MTAVVTTLFVITLTVAAYAFSLKVRERFASPLTTPVLLATSIVIAVLVMLRVDINAYGPGTS